MILFEDDVLLVLNKPPGLVCHPTRGDEDSSLIGRVRRHLGHAEGRLVNRLDRETSGIVLVAKGSGPAGELGRLFSSGAISKTYWAIVHGHVAGGVQGSPLLKHAAPFTIDAPTGQDVASPVAIKDCVRPDGQVARTTVRLLRTFHRLGAPFSVLEVQPATGRKHQIRIHLAHIGHPIVGDKIYGGDEMRYLRFVTRSMTPADLEALLVTNHGLHARALSFQWRGRAWSFEADPSEEMQGWLKGYAGLMSTLNDPVLPGTAASDYERYLRTDELLALQKPAGEMLHRDELLFQTIHQTAELWLKLAGAEIETATSLIDGDETWAAVRLLRRANQCVDLVASGTMMLEHLAPWDYHDVRRALGHGSGFDSPGFRRAHELSPRLAAAFDGLVARRGLDLARLYRESQAHEDVFQIAERLVDWDQRLIAWRTVHLKLVERIIGGQVIGTQGTPVEVLGRRLDVRFFPALWDIRNALTAEAQTSPPER